MPSPKRQKGASLDGTKPSAALGMYLEIPELQWREAHWKKERDPAAATTIAPLQGEAHFPWRRGTKLCDTPYCPRSAVLTAGRACSPQSLQSILGNSVGAQGGNPGLLLLPLNWVDLKIIFRSWDVENKKNSYNVTNLYIVGNTLQITKMSH